MNKRKTKELKEELEGIIHLCKSDLFKENDPRTFNNLWWFLEETKRDYRDPNVLTKILPPKGNKVFEEFALGISGLINAIQNYAAHSLDAQYPMSNNELRKMEVKNDG